ncbi:MAG TPA: hypothetical protein VD866_10370, partial [Urbifossiella sp.]|nr:hypothetical protein [Urbifossiella sp.]
ERRYPNEWVLIDQPRRSATQSVLGGYLVFHSPDKLAVYDRVKELPKPFDIAVWYTGPDDPVEEWLLNVGLFQ